MRASLASVAEAWPLLRLSPGDQLLCQDILRDQESASLQALVCCLLKAVRSGSVCLPLRLAEMANYSGFLDAAGVRAEDVLEAGLSDSSLISEDVTSCQPLIRTVEGTPAIYLQRLYVHQQAVNQQVERRLCQTDRDLSSQVEALRQIVRKNGLNQEQTAALCQSLLRRLSVISGGPGTGKTTVVAAIVEALIACGQDERRIVLAAPTGRAAQRLAEVAARAGVSLAAHTLHRLLAYSPRQHRYRYNAMRRLEADVVIVDEVSMVDVVMMSRLLAALPDGGQLVLVGDKDQLPSVDAGAVLADLLPEHCEPRYSAAFLAQARLIEPALSMPASQPGRNVDTLTLLTKSYRSQQRILDFARCVREGDAGACDSLPTVASSAPSDTWPWLLGGVHLLETNVQRGGLDQVLRNWFEHHFQAHFDHHRSSYCHLAQELAEIDLLDADELAAAQGAIADLFRYLDEARVVTIARQGLYGCDAINRAFAARYQHATNGAAQEGMLSGAPILITANDRELGVYNGDQAILVLDRSGNWRGVFRGRDAFRILPRDRLPRHELGFATTVHKSQGGEYHTVLLVLAPSSSRLLSREILYTGITRARDLVLIAGSRCALETGIGIRSRRNSGGGIWQTSTSPIDQEYADLPLFAHLSPI